MGRLCLTTGIHYLGHGRYDWPLRSGTGLYCMATALTGTVAGGGRRLARCERNDRYDLALALFGLEVLW